MKTITAEPVSFDHLNDLEIRLHNESKRLVAAINKPHEWAARLVIVQGIEREIAAERKFLCLPSERALTIMSDDDILKELGL